MIDWNGHCLQGKSSQEVANIIAESRDENQVELIVGKNHPDATNNSITCSNLPSATTTSMVPQRRIAAQAQWRQTHETMPILQQPHHRGKYFIPIFLASLSPLFTLVQFNTYYTIPHKLYKKLSKFYSTNS